MIKHIIFFPQKTYKIKAQDRVDAVRQALREYTKMIKKAEGFMEREKLPAWMKGEE